MQTVTIGTREIKIVFDGGAWADLQENDIMISKMNEVLSGKRRIRNMMKMVEVMGNRYKVNHGEEPELEAEKLLSELKMMQFVPIQVNVMNEIAVGMKMETETEDENKEHDVVLEEIKKKEQPED